MKYGMVVAVAIMAFAASVANAKTCEERFAAQGLSPTGLVANTAILFENAEYFVRPGESAQSICAKADKAKSAMEAKDAMIRDQKARISGLSAEVDQLKLRVGDTNFFKRHYNLGWVGWCAFVILLSLLLGFIAGRMGRRR